MSKRVETLKQLRDYVEQGKNIRHYYVEKVNDQFSETCYCAVGYLGHLYGLSDGQLLSAKGDIIGTDTTECIMDILSSDFSQMELLEIQRLNDDRYADVEIMIDYIDRLITEPQDKGEF